MVTFLQNGARRLRRQSAARRGAELLISDAELDATIAEHVSPVIHDNAGAAERAALLDGVSTTEFVHAALGQVVRSNRGVEVGGGEAIAELVEHRHYEVSRPGGTDFQNLPSLHVVISSSDDRSLV